MKILKPDSMAIVHRTLRLQDTDHFCVGLIACFPLSQPEPAALLPEVALWEAVPQLPGAPAMLDEGLPKPKAEYLVYGQAHTPQGQPMTRLVVSVRVGRQLKQLLVHGDRHWNAIGIASAAQPFTHMPITPQTAFGGAGDTRNPAGKGADDDGLRPLPNIEDPLYPVAFPTDWPKPAGYWSVDSSAPQRLQKLGAVDARWLKNTWPHLPDDTQPGYYQSAPRDQWREGFFVGDEALQLEHMHPEMQRIESRLPGLRAHCFAQQRRRNGDLQFVEMTTRAETVWLMPGLGLGAVLYRATLPVGDADALDVESFVAGWEPLQDARKPATFYLEQLANDGVSAMPIVPATAALAAVPVGPLVATAGLEMPLPAGKTIVPADPELAGIERMTAQLEAQTQSLLAKNGIPRSRIDALMIPSPDTEISLEEVEAMTRKMQTQQSQLLKTNGMSQADVDAFVKSRQEPQPVEKSLGEIQAMTQALQTRKSELMRANGMSGADLAGVLRKQGASEEAVMLVQQPPSEPIELPDEPAAVPPMASRPVPSMGMSKVPPVTVVPPRTPSPTPPMTREEVVAWHQQRRSFAGLTLPGLDLRDLDLAGADFSRAVLENTQFDRSKLVAARFDEALLQGASFKNIDGTKAQFARVRAAGSSFGKATLNGAMLDEGDFTASDFEGATLDHASCARTDFSGSRMAGLRAAGGLAAQADFSNCNLESADFKGASLTAARFNATRLADASFNGVSAERSEWYEADARRTDFTAADMRFSRAGAGTVFEAANLRGVRLDNAGWDGGVNLQRARLHLASLDSADLGAARASGAMLTGANARRANFSMAVLSGVEATGANFMDASLRRTQLDAARLTGANLHGSDCEGSTIGRAQMQGALITATLLQIAGRPELIKEQR
jgi:uncharacterized protein YjbI with pentapeptide repeats